MGRAKPLLRLGEETLLERALRHCAGYPSVVVASRAVAEFAGAHVRCLINGEPERGMTHSLRLAHAAIDPASALLVVPADLPFLDGELIARVASAPQADVVYPTWNGRPGHPVRFSVAARARLAQLPEGDTLRVLRDDPALIRRSIGPVDARTQFDIDTEDDLVLAAGRA
jgi:CTP:molybdopterin cytidylyltransferase MocA